jgi:hypothetical protein
MNIRFIPSQNYISIKDKPVSYTCIAHSNAFQINEKWYIRLSIDPIINTIDEACKNYAHCRNLVYNSCIFENSVLVKIPYRYKKFEVNTYNCTMYDFLKDQNLTVKIEPVSLSFINDAYSCTFKLINLKLNLPMKHPHAPLENEECATMQ